MITNESTGNSSLYLDGTRELEPETSLHLYTKVVVLPMVCVMVSFAALGNGLLVFVIVRSKDYRHNSDMYIASLATADLLMCVLVFPFSVVYELQKTWLFGSVFCDVWLFLESSLCAVMVYTMSMICMDVCFYVKKSFVKLHTITHNRIRTLIAFIWAAGLGLGGIPLILRNHVEIIQTDTHTASTTQNQCIFRETIYYAAVSTAWIFLLPFIWCIYVYCEVIIRVNAYIGVRKSYNAIHMILPHNYKYNLPSTGLFTITDIQTGILTLGIKLSIFFFSWLPYFIVKVLHPICGNKCTTGLLRSVVVWLPYVSSWVNPFIYGMLNKRVHKRLEHLCACCNAKWKMESQQSSIDWIPTTPTSTQSTSPTETIGRTRRLLESNLEPVSSATINTTLTADTNVQLMPIDDNVDPKVPFDPVLHSPFTSHRKPIEPGVVDYVNATYDFNYPAASTSIDAYLLHTPDKQPFHTFEAKQRQSDIAVHQKQSRNANILTPITPQVVDIAKLQAPKSNGMSEPPSQDVTRPNTSPKHSPPRELETKHMETMQSPKFKKKSAISTKSPPTLVQKVETSKKEYSQNLKSKKGAEVTDKRNPILETSERLKGRHFLMPEATKRSDMARQTIASLGQKPNSSKEGSLQAVKNRQKKSKDESRKNIDATIKLGLNSSSLEQKSTSVNKGSLNSLETTERPGTAEQESPSPAQKLTISKESQQTTNMHGITRQKQKNSKEVYSQSRGVTKKWPAITQETSSTSLHQHSTRPRGVPVLSRRHSCSTNQESSPIGRQQEKVAEKIPFKRPRSAQGHRSRRENIHPLAPCHLNDAQATKLLNENSLQGTSSTQEPSLIHQEVSPEPAQEFMPVTEKYNSVGSSRCTQDTEVRPEENSPQLPEDLIPRNDVSLKSPKSVRDLISMFQDNSYKPAYETKTVRTRSLQSHKSTRCSKTCPRNRKSHSLKPSRTLTEVIPDRLPEATSDDSLTGLVTQLTRKPQNTSKINTGETNIKSTRTLNTTKVENISRTKPETHPCLMELTFENLAAFVGDKTSNYNMRHSESVMAMASSQSSVDEDRSVDENTFGPHTSRHAFSRDIRDRTPGPGPSNNDFISCRSSTQGTETQKTPFDAGSSSPQRHTISNVAACNSNSKKHRPSKALSEATRFGFSKPHFDSAGSNPPKRERSKAVVDAGSSSSGRSTPPKTLFTAGSSKASRSRLPRHVQAASGSSPVRSKHSKMIVTACDSSPAGPVPFNRPGGSKRSSSSSDSNSSGMFVEVGSQIGGVLDSGASSDDLSAVKPEQSIIGSGDATGMADADDESVYFTADGRSVKNTMQLSGSEDEKDTENFWGIMTLKPRPMGQKEDSVQKESAETECNARNESPSSLSTVSTMFASHPKGVLAEILVDPHKGHSWSSSSEEGSNKAGSSSETFYSPPHHASPTAAKKLNSVTQRFGETSREDGATKSTV